MAQVLRELQEHVDIAIWTGSHARKAGPLFDILCGGTHEGEAEVAATSALLHNAPVRGFKPKFFWQGYQSPADPLRQKLALDGPGGNEEHASFRDLNQIWKNYSDAYHFQRTVFVDDSPSRHRLFADHLVWIKEFNPVSNASDDALLRLRDLVLGKLVPSVDVRAHLPHSLH